MARTRSLARAPVYLGLVVLVFAGSIQLNSALRSLREREIDTSLDVYNERLSNKQNLIVLGRLELLLGRLAADPLHGEDLVLEARLQAVMEEEATFSTRVEEPWLPAIFLVNTLRLGLGKEPLERSKETPGLGEVENGFLLERLRRFAEAEQVYVGVLHSEFYPGLRAPLLLHLAFCQIMQGRLVDADAHLRAVVRDYAGTEEALTARRMRDAIVRIETERRKTLPNDPAERARAYLQRLQFAEATGLAEEVLASPTGAENKARALAVLGEAAEAAGQPHLAADWYDRSLALDGDSPWATETRRRLVFLSRFQLDSPERAAQHEARLVRDGEGVFVANLTQISAGMRKPEFESPPGVEGHSWVVVDSIPSESTVLVGGETVGYTPLPLSLPLPEGRDLELERDGNRVRLDLEPDASLPLMHIWPPPEGKEDAAVLSMSEDTHRAPPSFIPVVVLTDPVILALESYLDKGWWIRPAWNEALHSRSDPERERVASLRSRAEARTAEESELRARLSSLYQILGTIPETQREEWKSVWGWTGVGTGTILLTGMGVSLWAGNHLYSVYLSIQDASAADLRWPLITLSAVSWTTGILGTASLVGGTTLVWQDFQAVDKIRRRGKVRMKISELEDELKSKEPDQDFFRGVLASTSELGLK